MSEDRRSVLEMLSQGKITADEAEKLIAALERETSSGSSFSSQASKPGRGESAKSRPKYLRVVVESMDVGGLPGPRGEASEGPMHVNIRVPMQLLRAGVKLASLIPAQARAHVNDALKEQGISVDLNQIKPENLEELIDEVADLTVDVNDPRNKVRIFCE